MFLVHRWKRITKNHVDPSSSISKQKKSSYSFEKEVYSKNFFRPRFEYILEPSALPCDRQFCCSIQSKISVQFNLFVAFIVKSDSSNKTRETCHATHCSFMQNIK